jgi:hypothetical protein
VHWGPYLYNQIKHAYIVIVLVLLTKSVFKHLKT